MRGTHCAAWFVLLLAFVAGCAVQTDVRTGAQGVTPQHPSANASRVGEVPPASPAVSSRLERREFGPSTRFG